MNSSLTGAPKRSVNDPVVLDASALLALFGCEVGAVRVGEVLPRAHISTVNLSEAVAKLIERGTSEADVDAILLNLRINAAPFDMAQATVAGKLRASTKAAGLSLGDRACLALALQLGATAVTADRAWSKLDIGVTIELLR